MMKRFVLYLVLVPIIAPLMTCVWQIITSGGNPFNPVLGAPGLFLWLAYFNWVGPALVIAASDRLQPFHDWRRFGIIAVAGYVSVLIASAALYGTFSGVWRNSCLVGAMAAVVCCLLLDQLNKERLGRLSSTLSETIGAARRWPYRAGE